MSSASIDGDHRTLVDLCREALDVQDACNLSGVVHAFSRSITRLRILLNNEPIFSTGKLNHHPVCVLFASKISSLAGEGDCAEMDAWQRCEDIVSPNDIR